MSKKKFSRRSHFDGYSHFTTDRISTDVPQCEPFEPGVVYWFRKRLYLGKDTQLRRLFDMLAHSPGMWVPSTTIQSRVFGTSYIEPSDASDTGDLLNQRLRKLVSRLKERFDEDHLSDSANIFADKRRGASGYVLFVYTTQIYKDGDAPTQRAGVA